VGTENNSIWRAQHHAHLHAMRCVSTPTSAAIGQQRAVLRRGGMLARRPPPCRRHRRLPQPAAAIPPAKAPPRPRPSPRTVTDADAAARPTHDALVQPRSLPAALSADALATPADAQPSTSTATSGGSGGPVLARLLSRLPSLDNRVRGLVLLNVMTVLMGSNWAVIKQSADSGMTDATVFMALRFILAAAVFLPFLRPDRRILKAGTQIGAWYAAGYVTQALALASTAASRASLLSTFTVLAVPMMAGLGGQKIRPVVWGCAAAALAGTAMLVRAWGRVCVRAGLRGSGFGFGGFEKAGIPTSHAHTHACLHSTPFNTTQPNPTPSTPHRTVLRKTAAAWAHPTWATPGPYSPPSSSPPRSAPRSARSHPCPPKASFP